MSNTSRVLGTKGNVVTQGYSNKHLGNDIVGTSHTTDTIIAHSDGVVVFCQTGQKNNKGSSGNASYGNCVKIKHENGYYTLYAHLEYVNVSLNQKVSKGQKIGYMGNTGNSYGNHLHFEVWNSSNIRVNPEKYLNADLPNLNTNTNTGCTGTITYQSYNGHWLSVVNKVDNTDNGNAGITDVFASGFRCKPQYGEIIYETADINGKWYGAVSSKDFSANNGNSYAGIIGQPMSKFRAKSTQGFVEYRVWTKEDGWLDWVRGFGDKPNEYAGITGHKIYKFQIK